MRNHYLLGGILFASITTGLAACADHSSAPFESSAVTMSETPSETLAIAGLRLRCEHRATRSKISVDGRNLSPRAGAFRARVRAAGGTATSGLRRAVGGGAEVDFDSNRGEGGTRISASFIQARAGADVVAEILNSQGGVVASRGADCESR
jgi:hypothetical protein